MKTVFLDFDSLHPGDLDTAQLDRELDDVVYHADSAGNEIGARLRDAEVAVVNKVQLTRTDMEATDALRLICLAATGSDNVDLAAARALDIAVCNIRDYCTPSVTQHVFALLLTLNQQLDSYRAQVRGGAWQASTQFCLLEPPIRELHDKTLGLIGLGALGSGVAGVARAFGMRVIAAQLPWRTATSPSGSGQSAPRVPLDKLLRESDYVSLHCPLNADTRHIIDARALQLMRPEALLVNTARGGLIDSEALVAALQNGDIAGAAVDVLVEEPPTQGDALLDADLPNLIVTPHVAWSAREARQRAVDQILANILAFAGGQKLNRLC